MSHRAVYTKEAEEFNLVERCLDNDRKAQKELYHKYCNAMYSSAYRILKDRDLASDALQEAFIHVFKILGQFQFRSTLGSWIKTIVIHASLKILKKQRAITIVDLSDNIKHVTWNDPMSGEHLEKAILALPAGYRAIFLLIEVEGYKHREAAEMLNISEGTSKSQLFHAKKYLRNLISSNDN
ncbi:MAG: sigma-70 family RNA polymerase sigma factor [Bacteroidota bacterium]